MKYNFLDPNQANLFKEEMTSKGYSPDDINSYIKSKVSDGNTLESQAKTLGYQADILKYKNEISGMLNGEEEVSAAGKEKQRFASLSRNTLEKMKNIYGMGDAKNVGTGKDLSAGEGVVPWLGRVVEGAVAKTTGISGAKRNAAKEFEDLSQMMVGQLSQAFGSGTPQEGEAQRLIKSMPSRSSSNATAKAWFENVDSLLAESAGEQTTQDFVSQDNAITSPEQVVFNVKGQIADPGDVILKEGKMERYQAPAQTFRTNEETGFVIDNALINFLADSWLVPAIGSVVGGMSGAGIGSIATGAAGAMAGKGIQQWARELRNPDESKLSDHARIMITEGVTDAVIGGLTMGVGKVAMKGYGMILGKVTKEVAEEGVEIGTKGVVEAVKEGAENRAVKLIRKASGITPTQSQKFLKVSGKDYAEETLKRGIYATAEEQAAEAGKAMTRASKSLISMLEQETVKVADVVNILEEAKKPFMRTVGDETVIFPAARQGIKEIDDYISWAKTFGETMPGTDANTIKRGLQESFGKGLDVSGSSKQLVTGTSTKLKEFIEELRPEIKGTNQEIIYQRLARELGEKEMTKEKAKSVLRLADLVVGSVNMPAAVLRKAIVTVTGVDDPRRQAILLTEIINLSSQSGNKSAVRSAVLAATRLKIPFSIDTSLVKQAGEAAVGQSVTQPISQEQTPQDFYK